VRTTQLLAIVSESQFQPEILRRVTGSVRGYLGGRYFEAEGNLQS
jgi:hypothetical protein